MALVFAALAALGVAYLHLAQRQYSVSATLAPSDAQFNMLTGVTGMSDIGSLSLSRLGLGIGSSDPRFSAFLQQLTSSATAGTLLSDDRVRASIFNTSWDARAHVFHPPTDFIFSILQPVKVALGLNPWRPPAAADMQRYLSHNVVAREIGISDLYSVSYSNRDPEFARYFLSRVLAISDSYLRQQKLTRARAYVKYLDQRLKVVSDFELRQAMLKLRLQQEDFIMAASVNLPFSADINDPPVTPSRPSWPNPLIVGIIIVVFGGGLAVLVGVWFRPYQALRGVFWRRGAYPSATLAGPRLEPSRAGE